MAQWQHSFANLPLVKVVVNMDCNETHTSIGKDGIDEKLGALSSASRYEITKKQVLVEQPPWRVIPRQIRREYL